MLRLIAGRRGMVIAYALKALEGHYVSIDYVLAVSPVRRNLVIDPRFPFLETSVYSSYGKTKGNGPSSHPEIILKMGRIERTNVICKFSLLNFRRCLCQSECGSNITSIQKKKEFRIILFSHSFAFVHLYARDSSCWEKINTFSP